MDAWIGLVGAVAGAVIALVGQQLAARSESRAKRVEALLEQCARLIALAEDYRNRVWEERHGLATGAVAGWDLTEYRAAEARVRLLTRSPRILEGVEHLRVTGVELGKVWRFQVDDAAAVDAAWAAYRDAIRGFTVMAAAELRSSAARG